MKDDVREFDPLTGLMSLTSFMNRVQVADSPPDGLKSVFIYVDILDFKTFNQTYGFELGNQFLTSISQEIRTIFPQTPAARFQGNNFVIYTTAAGHEEIIEKLHTLQDSMIKYERSLLMRMNAGVYFDEKREATAAQMMDRAKIACDYIADSDDLFYAFFNDEIAAKLHFKNYVITGFENALKNGYIQPWYQREVRTLTEKVCGYEALSRWVDPEYGMISPAVFIEGLENTHLIHKLDIYLINRVCEDIRKDIDAGIDAQPVSVNLSKLDFVLCNIFEEVEKSRKQYDIPVDLLHIEITESAFAEWSSYIEDGVSRFRNAGYEIWMDDFGSDYSSLNNLRAHEFDVIKIDREFLLDMEDNPKSKVILASVISMTKNLGMQTLAEGIETRAQFEFLKSIGCEKIQGYLFGKPRPYTEEEYSADLEPSVMHEYYRDLGRVNVLSTTPQSDLSRNTDATLLNDLPMAIAEISNDDVVSYPFANSSFIKLLKDIGIESLEEGGKRAQIQGMRENRLFREAANKSEQTGMIEACDAVINGNVINQAICFLSRTWDRAAYLLVSRNLSDNYEARQAGNIQASLFHLMSLFFRIDLYDEDGSVVNIYLNSDQKRVAQNNTSSKSAVAIYAENYISKNERLKFINFYDMSTIFDRVTMEGRGYVTEYFHSGLPGEEKMLHKYTILPFSLHNRWKMLSCCQIVDTPNITYK